MSSELIRKSLIIILNFYQLTNQFSWIVNVFKVILSIHPIFNLTEYREVIVKNSLLLYAGMQIRIWYSVAAMTNRHIFQLIDSLIMESWGVHLTWHDCITVMQFD